MKEIKIGNKKYKLQFGYAVVAKGGIVKQLLEMQEMMDSDSSDMSGVIEKIMGTLDELLLAALQKHHSNEFGYSVRTGNGHDEALEKVDDLLDKYFEDENNDPLALIADLSEELENNGFLRQLLRGADQTNE